MKLPSEVFGYNKVRDSKICSLFSTDGLMMEEIAQRFGLTHQRVSQIIYRNRHLLHIDKNFENILQLNRIKNTLKKAKPTTKDVLDWEGLLNQKIKENIDSGARAETRVIIIRESSDGDTNKEREIPRQISVLKI